MRNNKKLKQLTVLVALTACLFTGCSGNSSDTSKSKEENESAQEVQTTPAATLDTTIHTDNLMGIYIGENQSQIGLGLNTSSVKQVIGKTDKVEKNKGTEEKNKKTATQTWYYKELDTTITFEKSGDTYTVSSISGGKKATTLKTGGGITAGSSRADIVKAYKEQLGEDADTNKDKIVIDNMGYSQIVFTIENDVVVGITMELL